MSHDSQCDLNDAKICISRKYCTLCRKTAAPTYLIVLFSMCHFVGTHVNSVTKLFYPKNGLMGPGINERHEGARERESQFFYKRFSIDSRAIKKLRNETELLVGENQQTEEQIMINHVKMCGCGKNGIAEKKEPLLIPCRCQYKLFISTFAEANTSRPCVCGCACKCECVNTQMNEIVRASQQHIQFIGSIRRKKGYH